MTGDAAKRALITGVRGFVGQHLRRHLLEKGWEVVGCDVTVDEPTDEEVPCNLCDAASIDQTVEWAGPVTHVFHLAAITFVPESGRNPVNTFDVNLLGTVRLAESIRRHTPTARMIFISTSEVYGHPESLPITEDHPLKPANPYAISKAAADEYCRYLQRAGLLNVIRMRPFNHTGPGQSDQFVLSSFARQVAEIEAGKREPVVRVGNLESLRDFLHVSDVVHAYECAALQGIAGEAYNVSSGQSVRVSDALKQLLSMARAPIRVEIDHDRLRPVDVPEALGSYERLRSQTGWNPKIPFAVLLADLLDYWRAQ